MAVPMPNHSKGIKEGEIAATLAFRKWLNDNRQKFLSDLKLVSQDQTGEKTDI